MKKERAGLPRNEPLRTALPHPKSRRLKTVRRGASYKDRHGAFSAALETSETDE